MDLSNDAVGHVVMSEFNRDDKAAAFRVKLTRLQRWTLRELLQSTHHSTHHTSWSFLVTSHYKFPIEELCRL